MSRFPTGSKFPEIDWETARAWAADPNRTTYLLDVRTPEEFAAESLPGSLSTEGGQLLGLSSRTIATRGARLVLIDDTDAIRARTVAHWLHRRKYEIAILPYPFARADASKQPHATV